MNAVLDNLLKLQSLEFTRETKNAKGIAELRGKVPAPILAHYERLTARGKKGVALVQNQVCTGCHMRLTLAVIMSLRHGDDLQLCDTCGRYLVLAPETPPEIPVAAIVSKQPTKPARRRSSHAT